MLCIQSYKISDINASKLKLVVEKLQIFMVFFNSYTYT